MPKAKTHKSLSKRVKVTGKGKLKTAKVGKRHLLQNKSTKAKGRGRYGSVLPESDAKRIKKALKI